MPERTLKWLQALALVLALLAPWVFFVGYSYDSAYFEVFEIDQHMFFKAPQEYFGRAYLVLFSAISDWISRSLEFFLLVLLLITALVAALLSFVYLGHTRRWWGRLGYRLGQAAKNGQVSAKFFTIVVVPTYNVLMVPAMFACVLIVLILASAFPVLSGVRAGERDAEKIIQEWHDNPCSENNLVGGCAQLLDAGKIVASGIVVASSDKLAAIYNGKAVQIYALDKRELRLSSQKLRRGR